MFRAGDIAGVAAMRVAVRISLLIETDQRTIIQHTLDQAFILRLRSITPDHLLGARHPGHIVNPLLEWRSHIYRPPSFWNPGITSERLPAGFTHSGNPAAFLHQIIHHEI